LGIHLYNEPEIEKISKACGITANILDEIEYIIKEGISTAEIDDFTQKLCKKFSAEPAFLGYRGYPGAICTSVNDVVVHGIPSKNCVLKTGDIIGLDFGVLYEGYYGDSARTLVVGNVDYKTALLVDKTREALYKGIAAAVVGNRVSDISYAVESHVSEFGFTAVREYTGHGIGRNLHEEPSIPNYGSPGSGPKIRNGMVFAIEPMINAGTHRVKLERDGWTVRTSDNLYSAHFEHTVAIVDGKAKVLTRGKSFN